MRKPLFLVISYAWVVTVAAQCVQIAPFSESFNSNSTPTCWNNPTKAVFAGLSMKWFFGNDIYPGPLGPQGAAGSVDDHTGNGGYFAYAYAGFGPNLDLESPPIDVTGLTTPGLTFWMYSFTGGTSVNSLYVDVFSYSSGTWTLGVATITQNAAQWKYQNISLSAYANDTIQVRFRKGSSLNSGQDILIDDVKIRQFTSCDSPDELSIFNITGNSTDFSAQGSGTFHQYAVGFPGFNPDTVSRIGFVGDTVTINGLQPMSTYDLYVRDSCGFVDYSDWNYYGPFTTLCPVYSAPHFETFDFQSTPSCWLNDSPTFGSSALVQYSKPFSIPPPYFSANFQNEHTGNGGFYAFARLDYANKMDYALESPWITIDSCVSPVASLFVFNKAPFQTTSNGEVKVQVKGPNTSWQQIGYYRNYSVDWQQLQCDIPSTIMDTVKLRIVLDTVLTSSGLPYYESILFDDVFVGERPNCSIEQSISVDSVIGTTAYISWPNSGHFQVVYNDYHGLRKHGNKSVVFGNFIVLANLQPSKHHYFNLRRICGTDTSEWSQPVNFLTGCSSNAGIPFLEDFNTLSANDTSVASLCWQTSSNGNPRWFPNQGTTPSPFTGPIGDGTSSYGTYMYFEATGGSPGNYSSVTSPGIDCSSTQDSLHLRFKYHMYGSSIGQLSVDIYDGSNWHNNVWSISGQQQNSSNSPYNNAYVPLMAYSSSNLRVRFNATYNGSQGDIAIDNVSIIDTCIYPKPFTSFAITYDSLYPTHYRITVIDTINSYDSSWYDMGDGTIISGATVSHDYLLNGNYIITHYVKNGCGIIDSTTDGVTIQGVGQVEEVLPNTIIYPNPAKNALHIVSQTSHQVEVTISDSFGRILIPSAQFTGIKIFDISSLPIGIYAVTIERDNDIKHFKLIIN